MEEDAPVRAENPVGLSALALPAALRHFKQITLGKPILMGRRTFESLGRALPGRRNLVWTSRDLGAEGVELVRSLEEAIELARAGGARELMVIGGAGVYAAALPSVSRLYLTEVEGRFEGDTWFPELDDEQWRETSSVEHPADEKNPHDFRIRVLERVDARGASSG